MVKPLSAADIARVLNLPIGEVAALKKSPHPFAKSYRCVACGNKFFDDTHIPIKVVIVCPYCGKSWYEES